MAALAKYQDESGLWYYTINDSNSHLESSATAGFAYGFLKAVHKKYISSEYEEVANKAIAGLLNRLMKREKCTNMCQLVQEWVII